MHHRFIDCAQRKRVAMPEFDAVATVASALDEFRAELAQLDDQRLLCDLFSGAVQTRACETMLRARAVWLDIRARFEIVCSVPWPARARAPASPNTGSTC